MLQFRGYKLTPGGFEVDVEDLHTRQGKSGRVLYGGVQIAAWSSNPFLRQNMRGQCTNEAEAMTVADLEIAAGVSK
jgi:hypothetical protein